MFGRLRPDTWNVPDTPLRRPMRRVGDVLPTVAAELGIEGELRFARQLAAWQRIVGERVPAASGASSLLAIQRQALVVSASSPIVAQELRLRQADLLAAFAQAPEGERLIELRVVVRPAGSSGSGRL
jgi:predicted nucleic acid-binding Zn ribbon protein